MRRTLVVAAAAAVLLVAVPLAPAGATPPEDVSFVIETSIQPGGSGGPFIATGPAVFSGLMCPTGSTQDVFGKASGFQSNRGVNFQVVKMFTCDDGSGEFLLKLQVRIDKKGNNFNWVVKDGTGAFEDLKGTGGGFGIPDPPDGVIDVLDGKLHIH